MIALGRLALGDFRERSRRYSYLVTLAAGLLGGYALLPTADAGYSTLDLGGRRGLYNSAWIGHVIAIVGGTFLSIIGFYVVKNALELDRGTGVGQIIAATPLSRARYVTAKALSNFAVLSSILLALTAAAAVTQLLLGEDSRVDPWALLLPVALLALPVMAVVSAAAVLFEATRWLRGGMGNVAFFFLWVLALSSAGFQDMRPHPSDLIGVSMVTADMRAACARAYPGYDPRRGSLSVGINVGAGTGGRIQTFRWDGLRWDAGRVAWRLQWLLVAAALLGAAALVFDRFDPAAAPVRRGRSRVPRAAEGEAEAPAGGLDAPPVAAALPATLTPAPPGFRFGPLFAGELRLLLRGLGRWWYVVAAGLVVLCAVAPLPVGRGAIGFAWIWPMLAWSALGTRELRHGTAALIFSAPRPMARQLPAMWAAGAALAGATGAGYALRLLAAGEWWSCYAWVVGALFVPALALALGVWSGSRRPFEALYLGLWYVGPLYRTPALDFTGASAPAGSPGAAHGYLAATGVLLALAYLGRRRQLAR